MLFIVLTFFSTAATEGDVHSLPRNKGVANFSSSTNIDTPNENHQISAGLHEKQRLGGEVASMCDEEHVAAPHDGINNYIDAPLSNAVVMY